MSTIPVVMSAREPMRSVVFPAIGAMPLAAITPPVVLAALRLIVKDASDRQVKAEAIGQVPPALGLERAGRRGAHDRIEQAGAAFHARVSEAFERFAAPAWQRAHPEAGRIVADGPVGEVVDELHRAPVGVGGRDGEDKGGEEPGALDQPAVEQPDGE